MRGLILGFALISGALVVAPATAMATSARSLSGAAETNPSAADLRDQALAAFRAGADVPTLRALVKPLEAAAKAAPQGSPEQIDLDATLSRVWLGLRDERRANEAAQRAWRFAPGHWKDNPEVSGHAYVAISTLFLATGYIPDAWRVAEDGLKLWRDAHGGATDPDGSDWSTLMQPGGRFLDLVALSSGAAVAAMCSPDRAMMLDYRKLAAVREAGAMWDSPTEARREANGMVEYPRDMQARNLCGFAVLTYDRDADGRISNVATLLSGPSPSFGEAARAGLEQVRGEPDAPCTRAVMTFHFVLE